MNQIYRPIDCSLHDQLELRALLRTPCVLVYHDEHGGGHRTSAILTDLVTRGGEEFLCLDDGTAVRLDRIISVDGLARWTWSTECDPRRRLRIDRLCRRRSSGKIRIRRHCRRFCSPVPCCSGAAASMRL